MSLFSYVLVALLPEGVGGEQGGRVGKEKEGEGGKEGKRKEGRKEGREG